MRKENKKTTQEYNEQRRRKEEQTDNDYIRRETLAQANNSALRQYRISPISYYSYDIIHLKTNSQQSILIKCCSA